MIRCKPARIRTRDSRMSAHAHEKTVLMLAYYFPPQQTSGAVRPARFAKYLREYGFRAVVVAGDPEGSARLHGAPPDLPGAPAQRTASGIGSGALRIAERLLREHSQRLHWMPNAVSAAARFLRREPCDAIWSTSPPISTHLAAMYLAARFHLPWIADFRDPFADAAREPAARAIYGRKVERAIIRRAAAVIANNDAAADRWTQHFPEYGHKVHAIWNGFDPEERFDPPAARNSRSRVLAHVGDIYGARHPGAVLTGIDRMIQRGILRREEIRVRLIGPVEVSSPLWAVPSFTRLLDQGRLDYTACAVPRLEALRQICEADCLLLLDIVGADRSVQVPAKLFDYIRAGRPILAVTPEESPTRTVLAHSGIPHVCLRPDAPDAEVDDAVISLLKLPSGRSRPSEWFHEAFDVRRHTAVLADLLDHAILAAAARVQSEHDAPREVSAG